MLCILRVRLVIGIRPLMIILFRESVNFTTYTRPFIPLVHQSKGRVTSLSQSTPNVLSEVHLITRYSLNPQDHHSCYIPHSSLMQPLRPTVDAAPVSISDCSIMPSYRLFLSALFQHRIPFQHLCDSKSFRSCPYKNKLRRYCERSKQMTTGLCKECTKNSWEMK